MTITFTLKAISIFSSCVISPCTYMNGLNSLPQTQPSHRETHGINPRLSPLCTSLGAKKKTISIS